MRIIGLNQSQKSIRKFESWVLASATASGNEDLEGALQRFRVGGISDQEASNRFIEALVKALADGGSLASLLLGFQSGPIDAEISLTEKDVSDLHDDTAHVHLGSVTIGAMHAVALRGVRIGSIIISRHKHRRRIQINSCWIKRLEIQENASAHIELNDCWVGELLMRGGKCVERLSIKGGTIRSVSCAMPGQSNPLAGSVTVSEKVDFPTSPKSKIFQGAQGYRSLRAHLEALENLPAANLFRRLELETERHFEDSESKGVNFFVSWVYGFFADYGMSPGRSLVWALFVWSVASAAVFCTDGGAFIEGEIADRYFGWRQILTDQDIGGRLFRSIILPVQSAFNPLGILGPRLLVTASEWWTQIWLVPVGLFLDALLLMSIFGIRKRFKLN